MAIVKWGSWPIFFALWLLAGMVWWQALLAAAGFALVGGYVVGKAGA